MIIFSSVCGGVHKRKNVLDLILTTEENMVENLAVGEPSGTSDHQIIRCDFVACK